MSHDSSVNFDLWIQNLQWNRSQISVDCLGLDTYVTLSAEDEAALVVVGHCVILQKSMDSTGAETQGELLFNFILSTVSRDCDTAQIRYIKSMGYYPSEKKQHAVNINWYVSVFQCISTQYQYF